MNELKGSQKKSLAASEISNPIEENAVRKRMKGRSQSLKTLTPSFSKKVRYKLAGYVRLSPSDEIRGEGSLVSHPQRIQGFVDFKNTQSPDWGEIVEWYTDKDYSGKDINRPAFQRMLQDIKHGRINAVIVTELSRLSRDVKDFCHFWEFLKSYNASFFSLKENFDTSTPIGEMMVIQCISFAQFERKTIVQRVKDGARARAERGLANGWRNVIGYDPDPKNKHRLIVNEGEASTVRMIFNEFLKQGSVAKTRSFLNDSGYRMKTFVTQDERQGGGHLWTDTTLHTLLTNAKYLGKVEINKINRFKDQADLLESEKYRVVPATWPAIVDELTYNRVQEMLIHNCRFGKKHNHVYLLSGLLRCGSCGEELIGVSANGKNDKYFYYGHKRKFTATKDRHNKRCPLERIPAERLEDAIISRLIDLAKSKNLLAQLVADASKENVDLGKDIDHLIDVKEQERRSVQRYVDNLLASLAEIPEGLSPKIVFEKIADYERQRERISQEISNLRGDKEAGKAKVIDLDAVMRLFRIFQKDVTKRPAHEQRETIREVLHKAIVNEKDVKLIYNSREREDLIGFNPVESKASSGDKGDFSSDNNPLATRWSGFRSVSRKMGPQGLEPRTRRL